jgi:putative Holliday junction resolvase
MNDDSTRRILGIDAGERRIGVAISDPGRSFALPLDSVLADGSEFERLGELIAREDVGEIVVGLPLSMSGESSAQTELARAFAAKAEERLGLPVHMWDERLSSREAERLTSNRREGGREGSGRERGRRGGRGGKPSSGPDTDAMAASIILQAFLDSRRFRV